MREDRVRRARRGPQTPPSKHHGHKYSRTEAPPSVEEKAEPEAYKPCGTFRTDFAALCRETGLPYVPDIVPRPLALSKTEVKRKTRKVTAGSDKSREEPDATKKSSKAGKKESKLTAGASATSPHSVTRREGSNATNMSAAFSRLSRPSSIASISSLQLVDRADFFMPRIQVEQENPEDERTVREVYIHGWKVDVAMMKVLAACLPVMPLLGELHLWRVGLARDTLAVLTTCVPLCPTLTTLVLDGNTLTACPLHALLSPAAVLQHLSLRFCGLGDEEVAAVGRALCWVGGDMVPLVSLCLTGNKVGDEGAGWLARALSSNRFLRAVNLTGNRVGDEGARRLARACTWRPVTGDWLTARRQHLHQYLLDHPPVFTPRPKKPRPERPPSPTKKGAKGRRSPRISKTNRSTSQDKRDSKDMKDKQDSKDSKASPALLTVPTAGGVPEPEQKEEKEEGEGEESGAELKIPEPLWYLPGARPDYFAEADVPVEGCGLHPLMQPGYLHDNDLWLPGNRTLTSLNLSRNQVGKAGVKALLEALREQEIPVAGGDRGLLRVVLTNNVFPPDYPPALLLSRLLRRKNTFHVPRINVAKPCLTPCAIADTALV